MNSGEMFPAVVRLDESSRQWLRKDSGVKGYSSEDGDYEILVGNGYAVLVSFIHEVVGDEEFWRKRFRTVKEAMEYAEKM